MRLETTDLIKISAFVKLLNGELSQDKAINEAISLKRFKVADLNNWYNRSERVIDDYPELRDTIKDLYGCEYKETFGPIRGVYFVKICDVKFIYLPLTNLQLAKK